MKRCLCCVARGVILFFLILKSLVACTVKEDRTECPCVLEVSFNGREQLEDSVFLVGWTEKMVFEENIDINAYPDTYKRKVPKAMLSFGAVEGLDVCVCDNHSVIIPEGQECDSLYAYRDYIDCTGEKAYTTVEFHKQFATVYIFFSKDNIVAQDYSFAVESNSCGINVLTCGPVEGHFFFEPELLDGRRMNFRLPRQCDDTLSLAVSNHPSGARVILPLGDYISSIGYDWEATELQDIYILLDLAQGTISVGVAKWEEIQDFEMATIEI